MMPTWHEIHDLVGRMRDHDEYVAARKRAIERQRREMEEASKCVR